MGLEYEGNNIDACRNIAGSRLEASDQDYHSHSNHALAILTSRSTAYMDSDAHLDSEDAN